MFSIKQYVIQIAALLTSCFFMFACENDEKKIEALFKNRAAIEEAFKIESYLSQNGQVKARLIAPYMMMFRAIRLILSFHGRCMLIFMQIP